MMLSAVMFIIDLSIYTRCFGRSEVYWISSHQITLPWSVLHPGEYQTLHRAGGHQSQVTPPNRSLPPKEGMQ